MTERPMTEQQMLLNFVRTVSDRIEADREALALLTAMWNDTFLTVAEDEARMQATAWAMNRGLV